MATITVRVRTSKRMCRVNVPASGNIGNVKAALASDVGVDPAAMTISLDPAGQQVPQDHDTFGRLGIQCVPSCVGGGVVARASAHTVRVYGTQARYHCVHGNKRRHRALLNPHTPRRRRRLPLRIGSVRRAERPRRAGCTGCSARRAIWRWWWCGCGRWLRLWASLRGRQPWPHSQGPRASRPAIQAGHRHDGYACN